MQRQRRHAEAAAPCRGSGTMQRHRQRLAIMPTASCRGSGTMQRQRQGIMPTAHVSVAPPWHCGTSIMSRVRTEAVSLPTHPARNRYKVASWGCLECAAAAVKLTLAPHSPHSQVQLRHVRANDGNPGPSHSPHPTVHLRQMTATMGTSKASTAHGRKRTQTRTASEQEGAKATRA